MRSPPSFPPAQRRFGDRVARFAPCSVYLVTGDLAMQVQAEARGIAVPAKRCAPASTLRTQTSCSPGRCEALARHLLGPRVFSGWGVRTLAEGEGRFNPIGYHVGTVWPFDNSFIAWGLCRYGFEEKAAHIAAGMLDAADFFAGRLPEVFGGYASPDADYEEKAARVLALCEAPPRDEPVLSFQRAAVTGPRSSVHSVWPLFAGLGSRESGGVCSLVVQLFIFIGVSIPSEL